MSSDIGKLCANTIRTLSMDGVQKANSGHPGMPMGAADYAYVLWSEHLMQFPGDPNWANRDRFILSAGHGSMLIYSLLHLSGYDFSIEDLKQFRQWESKTPGHPESELPGVETTTGPLGQGIANAVGMAIASKMSAARFNTEAHSVVSNRVFTIVGDGCLMEGISTEAASLAAHLKLDNLVVIYDDNKITIDGPTNLAFSEDIPAKFKAMGWKVLKMNGHDQKEISKTLKKAVKHAGQPVLVVAESHIAFGSPNKQDTADAHGAPLGDEEIAATKKNLGWEYTEPFHVPQEVYDAFKKRNRKMKKEYNAWKATLAEWEQANPEKAALRKSMLEKNLPEDLEEQLIAAMDLSKADATRNLSGKALCKAYELAPAICGGSADLAPSNKTYVKGEGVISADDFGGRNFHFGIREHAMGAIMNGMALYGGFIPYGGTFLVFADYMRTPIRLSSLMKQQVIYVFTHDSFYVGEDGPTHQPVEHLATLRAIPGVNVFRPADPMETAVAWASALRRKDGPTVLSLTRQNVKPIERPEGFSHESIAKGGYVASKESGDAPEAIIVATGSEVGLAIDAKKLLGDKGANIRVVSLPCLEAFEEQPESYKNEVIPSCKKMVAIEAGVKDGWYKYVGRCGLIISMDRFGASAPGNVLAGKLGFTAESVAERISKHIEG